MSDAKNTDQAIAAFGRFANAAAAAFLNEFTKLMDDAMKGREDRRHTQRVRGWTGADD